MSLTKASYSMITGAPINVLDFGADPTGVTDSTSAIQAALALQGTLTQSLQTSGGLYLGTTPAVHFPKGEYLISATLNGISDYAIITGEAAALKKAATFAGTSAFQMIGNAWRVYIQGLQFEDFANGIYLDSNNQNSGQVVISECGFFGCTNRAIWIDCQSSVTLIENCIWRSNRYDLYVETGDLVVVEGGWISRADNKAVNNYDGYIINFGEKLVLRNVLCVPPAAETAIEPAWIVNHRFVDCDGVRFGGESGGIVAVNNAADGSPFGTQTQKYGVSIRNCELYVGANRPAVRVFYVPNAIILENNMGLTGSGAYAVGWSPSVTAPQKAARLPALGTPESRWFFIHNRNNNGQAGIIDADLLAYATTNPQLRLFSDAASGRNIIFDYLSETIVAGDIYGVIEFKGYDGSTSTGRRGSIIARANSTGGGLELIFQTGSDFGAVNDRLVLEAEGPLRPAADNTQKLGTASFRWSEVFAGNGTINTSDAREKQQIRALTDAERAVAVRCKSLLRAFKFNDAVQSKADNARIHFGIVAQDLADAFVAEGLDPALYAMFCYDKWDDVYHDIMEEQIVTDAEGNEQKVRVPTGEKVLVQHAGDRYGVRYEELLAFIISAI